MKLMIETRDETSPAITGVDPWFGATGVGTNAVVRIAFNERINPLTVTPVTFRVLDSLRIPIPGSVTVAADRRSATFTPASGMVQ